MRLCLNERPVVPVVPRGSGLRCDAVCGGTSAPSDSAQQSRPGTGTDQRPRSTSWGSQVRALHRPLHESPANSRFARSGKPRSSGVFSLRGSTVVPLCPWRPTRCRSPRMASAAVAAATPKRRTRPEVCPVFPTCDNHAVCRMFWRSPRPTRGPRTRNAPVSEGVSWCGCRPWATARRASAREPRRPRR